MLIESIDNIFRNIPNIFVFSQTDIYIYVTARKLKLTDRIKR